MPGNYVREKSSFTDTDDSVFPPKILTAAHLSSLRDLLSDKKITGEMLLLLLLCSPVSQAVMCSDQQQLSMKKVTGILFIKTKDLTLTSSQSLAGQSSEHNSNQTGNRGNHLMIFSSSRT